jgi:hypothetical protein
LSSFRVPTGATGLVHALNDHFVSNLHLHTARLEDGPCFRLGTKEEITSRRRCPFCRIAASAICIGNNLTGNEDIHVHWAASPGKLDLATISESGSPQRAVLTLGVRIVFCEEPNNLETNIQWGRATNISGFDEDQVRRWLSLCETGHKRQCWPSPTKPSSRPSSLNDHEFRLIDVRQECIVIRPWQSRYLALTYVWGQVDQLKLLKDNLNCLHTPGSLRRLQHCIPKTIRDAVLLVNLIGEEYLWVDALCLIQDDHESMVDGIQSMHFVFQNALASIVAADGLDANLGLIRLASTSSSKTQSLQTIKPGFRLMAVGAMELHLKKSKWTSRAWT